LFAPGANRARLSFVATVAECLTESCSAESKHLKVPERTPPQAP